MQFKGIVAACALATLITGCATSDTDHLVKKGGFSEAFYGVSMYRNSVPQDVVKSLSQKIKDSGGSGVQADFLNKTLAMVSSKAKNADFFLDMRIYTDQAEQNGLLSPQGAEKLNSELSLELARQITLRPSDFGEKVRNAYPMLPKYMAQARAVQFERAIGGQLGNLQEYVALYMSLLADDAAKAEQILPVIRTRVAKESEKAGDGSLKNMIGAYLATKDPEVKTMTLSYLQSGGPSRQELKEFSSGEFAEPVKIAIGKREVRVKVVSDSNDAFVDDLVGALPKRNDWLVVDEEAERTLTVSRLKFNERESSPLLRTQTVSDLDFATLLLIPRNASVLFDYSTTKYDLNWSMSIRDSKTKTSKVISGRQQVEKTECSNVRYRNVFGGEGALGFVPNGISAFCSRSSAVNFEATREDVVKGISKEVADFLLGSSETGMKAGT